MPNSYRARADHAPVQLLLPAQLGLPLLGLDHGVSPCVAGFDHNPKDGGDLTGSGGATSGGGKWETPVVFISVGRPKNAK